MLPALAVVLAVHLRQPVSPEPVFHGDENRHVMTGVFFRDLLADQPVFNVKQYAESYYVQYPALGLLVWPPLFYFAEGAAMSVFGTSYLVGRCVVTAFALLACVYLNRLVSRTHGRGVAAAVVLLFAFTPLVFVYSRQVMLEVPTLALCLMATFHFVRYLDESRRRDVFIAAIASACAALTRFDAVYLLPLFVLLLLARSRFDLLWRREVLAAAGVALLMVAPFYALAATEVGSLHSRQASQAVVPETADQTLLERLLYYPASIPQQTGLVLGVVAVGGLIELRHWERRRENLPYLAMLIATWLTFTPIAEQQPRHAIYWVPALAVLAWSGITAISRCRFQTLLRPALFALLLGSTVSAAVSVRRPDLSGYQAAARWVLGQSPEPSRFLFDGWLDGNFTFHVRHLDPERRHTVLRGDKLFYGFLCVPETDFAEYASNEQEMLDILHEFDPAFIVVETPLSLDIPTAERLRDVLREHPEKFELANEIPVTGRCGKLGGYSLKIYRNLKRNPQAGGRIRFEVKGLKRSVSS